MEKIATNAVDVLHRRYIGVDADRIASLRLDREKAENARVVMAYGNRRGCPGERSQI